MTTEKQNRIPQIVIDYIAKLRDKNVPKFQREIACTVLERIVEECNTALTRYNVENNINRRA